MYAQSRTSDLVLHHLTVEQFIEYEMSALVTQMRACVLGEDGGDTAERTEVVVRKVKPRWMPKYLWARIFNEYVQVKVTAKPLWTYPRTNIQVPDLGREVRIVLPGGGMRVDRSDYG